MFSTILQWLQQPDLIKYISIPITCAFVGWLTNFIAVRMIFHPAEFIGWGKLGWKGIIPNHAVKMSGKIAKVLTERLVKPNELYAKVDPNQINYLIHDLIKDKAEEIVKAVVKGENPVIWSLLSDSMKKDLADELQKEIPKQIVAVYESFGKDLDSVLELDEIIQNSLSGKNTSVLIEMFQRCSAAEFRFIIISGIYFGMLIGFIQLLFIKILGQPWTMPVMGVVVGYLTNWLALQMIFLPLEEKRFGFFKYQGLFLRRQDEVSQEFAAVVANNVLNTSNLIKLIFTGKGGDLLAKLIIEKAHQLADEKVKEKVPMAPMLLGSAKIEKIKEVVAEKILLILPEIANNVGDHLTTSLEIDKTIYERLRVLPKAEFEDLLHSVFKEDEMTLILLGALLGGLVGLIQASLVF
ncbi:MAG: DUF445 family protein [Spirochaetota bacterium]